MQSDLEAFVRAYNLAGLSAAAVAHELAIDDSKFALELEAMRKGFVRQQELVRPALLTASCLVPAYER